MTEPYTSRTAWARFYAELPPEGQAAAWPTLDLTSRYAAVRHATELHPTIVLDILTAGDRELVGLLLKADRALPWDAITANVGTLGATVRHRLARLPDAAAAYIVELAQHDGVAAAQSVHGHDHDVALAVLRTVGNLAAESPARKFLRSALPEAALTADELVSEVRPVRCLELVAGWYSADAAEMWRSICRTIRERGGNDAGTWQVFASLQPEFVGTADELIITCAHLSTGHRDDAADTPSPVTEPGPGDHASAAATEELP